MTETALAVRPEEALALALADDQKLDILRETLASDLNAAEFGLFVEVCRSTGLNPFQKQIYAISRGRDKNRKLTFQTGIDGYRVLAARTGFYDGQDEPEWCGPDGVWRDVWTDAEPPFAARVRVYRKDTSRPFTGIAKYSEYVQTATDYNSNKVGPNSMWAKMPTNQLAKCAEALALRKAFPADMAGVYTEDEMGQADNDAPKDVTPARSEAREVLRTGSVKAETAAQAREQIPDADKEAAAKRQKMLDALDDWARDVFLFLEPTGHKMSELSVVIGCPVTPKSLREWAAKLGPDGDPYMEMTSVWARNLPADPMPEPEPEAAPVVVEGEIVSQVVETPSGMVDTATGEIIGDASQFPDPDDEAFE